MKLHKTTWADIEKALWQPGAPEAPWSPQPSPEAWQAGVMRAIRLAADHPAWEWAVPWALLQRTTALLLLTAIVGGLAVWRFTPGLEAALAQESWQSRVNVVNVENWMGSEQL